MSLRDFTSILQVNEANFTSVKKKKDCLFFMRVKMSLHLVSVEITENETKLHFTDNNIEKEIEICKIKWKN